MRLADAILIAVEQVGGGSGGEPAKDARSVVAEYGPSTVARSVLGIPLGRGRLPAPGSVARVEYERLRRELSALTRGSRPSREASAQVERFARSRRGRARLSEDRFARGAEALRGGAAVLQISGVFRVSADERFRTIGRYGAAYRREPAFLIPGTDMGGVLSDLDRYRRGARGGPAGASRVEGAFESGLNDGYMRSPRGDYMAVVDVESLTLEPRRVLPPS